MRLRQYRRGWEWEFIEALPRGGHRLFRDVATGRVSIADHSGDEGGYAGIPEHLGEPHETDCGPLWLDTTRPIVFDMDGLRLCSLPVLVEDEDAYGLSGDGDEGGPRRQATSPIGFDHALILASRYGFRIECDGVPYLVAEKGQELTLLQGA